MTDHQELMRPGTPGRARDVLDRMDELRHLAEQTYLEMGALLYEIKEQWHYRVLGFDTFEAYCEQHLGFAVRKGHYLANLHGNLIVKAGLTPADLDGIGWTAAGTLASLPEEELKNHRAQAWLERAKRLSRDDLVQQVRQAKKGEPDPEVPLRKVFVLFPEQYKNVMLALENSARIADSNKEGHLLDMICLAFNASCLETRDASVQGILCEVDRVFGVECIATKVKGDKEEIVYGKEVAKKMGVE